MNLTNITLTGNFLNLTSEGLTDVEIINQYCNNLNNGIMKLILICFVIGILYNILNKDFKNETLKRIKSLIHYIYYPTTMLYFGYMVLINLIQNNFINVHIFKNFLWIMFILIVSEIGFIIYKNWDKIKEKIKELDDKINKQE